MASKLRSVFLLAVLLGCGSADRAEPPVVEPAPEAPAETASAHSGNAAEPIGPFLPVSDSDLQEQIDAALNRASESDKQVLLEFLANWCVDCQEVLRVSGESPAREVLQADYEIVYVEVGRFDRHTHLIERYGIESIATLVVLDPSGSRVAQTTLEPISRHRPLTSEALASWLRNPS